jgi:hypothetical protein
MMGMPRFPCLEGSRLDNRRARFALPILRRKTEYLMLDDTFHAQLR